ncbi:Exopolysaccharide biosynthesis protein [Sporobacter termitidis DSM 10068]|uniref:Exopolysaccharide biosynthesis protein n=1 Tax=Sporobacter termitidis DSM 10068 TaxID=1123282 RepID=A0A1M5TGR3_9FIRM|nr:phosphodiester glycosidase family protein [Sporobacter termitidis]SHH49858.1 Exopolysaccharide biosynthesis protein [Sporobacter termitidis DSM 10068]
MARAISKTVLFGGKTKQIHKIEPAAEKSAKRRSGKAKKRLIVSACVLAVLAGIYCTAVFSNIPFIKKWRDIYIETAMETLNHKWLATAFIPASVIDAVMDEQNRIIAEQQNLKSAWGDASEFSDVLSDSDDTTAAFFEEFKQLDQVSFNAYIDTHPEVLDNGYAHLLINEAGLKDKGTTIKTTQGDQVLAVDAENGIIIVKITGDGYAGKMAIVEDPSRVGVGVAQTLGSSGQSVAQIAKANDAILAINASGFADFQGTGNGGKVMGLLISNGKKYSDALSGTFMNIGFGLNNRLYIGVSTKDMTYRDAVQFLPALVVNGDNVIEDKTFKKGTTAFGIQPRTAIGQAADGTVLLLAIDGRKPGYSLGCTVEDCADILLRYNAVQASNLDGGSSTVMVFRGKEITDPADSTDYGRPVPDAIIVMSAEGVLNRPDVRVSSGGSKSAAGSGSSGTKTDSGKPSPSPTPDKVTTPSPSAEAPSESPSPSVTPDTEPSDSPPPSASASPDVSPDSSPSADIVPSEAPPVTADANLS